ncbi:prephenate dehydratase [Deinobacterium chartae]|uniref:prephenate dehydratase n=1 Tax=Deinobacterium chartae TaxID=521158 RepID=A0A841HUX1_9DEIO|nr:prephenate dehydratase domain-containing protein [Deinobacterium chartae]MBB6097167.1 prephenate dehydratase [Deinobacterium chartae]
MFNRTLRSVFMISTVLAVSGASLAADLAYLGPRGTYSDQAAALYASSHPGLDRTVPLSTITEVATQVAEGKMPYGLLPSENTSGAFVAETYGLLLKPEPGWRVIGEIALPISNNLMVKPGTKFEDIKTIYSHPQPVRQSAGFLKSRFPNTPIIETKSTAAAAEEVAKGDGTSAALSAPAAAGVYGLEVLAADTQDDKANTTNFWAIQKAGLEFPEKNPTHLLVTLEAPAGSSTLSSLFTRLRALGFNAVNVESQPMGGALYAYRYAAVFSSKTGNDIAKVQAALEAAASNGGKTLLVGAWRR